MLEDVWVNLESLMIGLALSYSKIDVKYCMRRLFEEVSEYEIQQYQIAVPVA